jgi:hypothetical protein
VNVDRKGDRRGNMRDREREKERERERKQNWQEVGHGALVSPAGAG